MGHRAGWRTIDVRGGGGEGEGGGRGRGGGEAARKSNGMRSQDPGGGEMQLTSVRDETVVWPVQRPTLHSVGLQSGEVRVFMVSVDG